MKKTINLFIFLFLAFITNAQSKLDTSSSLDRNFENTNKLIQNLSIKVDSIDIKNEVRSKNLKDSINKLNKIIEKLKLDSTNLQVNISNLSKKDSLNTLASANSEKVKEQFDNIIQQLSNQNSNINPEILKLINDVNIIVPLKKIDVLANFTRLTKTISNVREYLNNKPYDSLLNNNYLDSLSSSKQEINSFHFKNLGLEIDFYIDLLEMYCSKTKEVGKEINESVGSVNELNRPIRLLNQKRKTMEFGFLLNEIKKAQRTINYKFIFKACTD
jgi:hypothetical protein